MERHFHEELGALKDALLGMADLAEGMIDDSILVLVERKEALLASIEEREAKVNSLQRDIDDRCLKLIALHQPTASDLRFILGCVKTNTDLERLADEAINVSHKAKRLLSGPRLSETEALGTMGKIASAMVRDAVRIYVSGKAFEASELIQRDKALNDLKRQATDLALGLMCGENETVRRGLDIVLAARNIERIGDHAKNIAENAIFVAEGRDVRHGHLVD
jgi:phosphate transport system protein